MIRRARLALKQWLIKRLVEWMTPRLRFVAHNHSLWRHVERHGYHVTPVHFYQPIPNTQTLDATYRSESAMAGVDWNEAAQLQLLAEVFPRYAAEYQRLFSEFRGDRRFAGARLEFTGHDPQVYYCMLRHFQPRTVIEIGAGFSTMIAAKAARQIGGARVIAIEPHANIYLDALAGEIRHIRQPVQSLELGCFQQLDANDILFIDSSHVVKTGSDVCYLALEVLPSLKNGVIVHFHDIFLPSDYPRDWLTQRRLFWNEQYLVQAYLMHNHRARILFANSYMNQRHGKRMRQTFPESESSGGGSLWFQV